MAPQPEVLGFIRYAHANLLGIPIPEYMMAAPRESDDARAFLTAVFYYSTQEFNDKYVNDELVVKKFGIIKNLAKEAGFRFPD